jgi:hypothetical protein
MDMIEYSDEEDGYPIPLSKENSPKGADITKYTSMPPGKIHIISHRVYVQRKEPGVNNFDYVEFL